MSYASCIVYERGEACLYLACLTITIPIYRSPESLWTLRQTADFEQGGRCGLAVPSAPSFFSWGCGAQALLWRMLALLIIAANCGPPRAPWAPKACKVLPFCRGLAPKDTQGKGPNPPKFSESTSVLGLRHKRKLLTPSVSGACFVVRKQSRRRWPLGEDLSPLSAKLTLSA